MQPEAKFCELQKVGPLRTDTPAGWEEGIVVNVQWLEAEHPLPDVPFLPPGWIYAVQTEYNGRPNDIWWPESYLEAR